MISRNDACLGGNTPGDMIVVERRGENCLLYRYKSDLRPKNEPAWIKSRSGSRSELKEARSVWREAGSKGAKDRSCTRLQRVPDNVGSGAACSLYKESEASRAFSSEGKGCDLDLCS